MQAWRDKAEKRWHEMGGNTRAQEICPYLPASFLQHESSALHTLPSIEAYILPEFSHRVVFVDGHFVPALSSLPKELICQPLDLAFQSYGLFLHHRWTQGLQEEKDPFAVWNAAFHGRGAFLYAPPKAKIRLQILHVFMSERLSSPRLQITLGKEAEMQLVQTVAAVCPTASFNRALDVSLDAGSSLRLLDVNLTNLQAVSSCKATLKRDARFEAVSFMNGSELSRDAFSVELAEENSSASVRALAMLAGARRAHVQTLIDHAAPNCTSHQHVKMALAETSSGSFEGKIFVRPIAQKTMAYQLNNNLLLSDEAKTTSKPNLEIFADDVKASHGSTVTQLSPEDRFYLQSRGLGETAANALLAEGFCKEWIDQMDIASLQAPLYDAMQNVVLHAR